MDIYIVEHPIDLKLVVHFLSKTLEKIMFLRHLVLMQNKLTNLIHVQFNTNKNEFIQS